MEKLINQRSFVLLPHHMETPSSISVSVPDESMSIRTLLERYSRGQPLDMAMRREGRFEEHRNEDAAFDSEDLEAASRTELTDRDEVVDRIKDKIDISKADLNRQQEAAAAKKLAIEKAKKLKSDDENTSRPKSPPARSTEGARERGATGGQAKGEYSGESNEE